MKKTSFRKDQVSTAQNQRARDVIGWRRDFEFGGHLVNWPPAETDVATYDHRPRAGRLLPRQDGTAYDAAAVTLPLGGSAIAVAAVGRAYDLAPIGGGTMAGSLRSRKQGSFQGEGNSLRKWSGTPSMETRGRLATRRKGQ